MSAYTQVQLDLLAKREVAAYCKQNGLVRTEPVAWLIDVRTNGATLEASFVARHRAEPSKNGSVFIRIAL